MRGNIEVARELIDAVNRRDLDAFLGLVRPDVEWDGREGWPGIAGVYTGPGGVRDWWDRFLEVWIAWPSRSRTSGRAPTAA
jgi:ketosteroid isomerase-like protein